MAVTMTMTMTVFLVHGVKFVARVTGQHAAPSPALQKARLGVFFLGNQGPFPAASCPHIRCLQHSPHLTHSHQLMRHVLHLSGLHIIQNHHVRWVSEAEMIGRKREKELRSTLVKQRSSHLLEERVRLGDLLFPVLHGDVVHCRGENNKQVKHHLQGI